MTAARPNSRPSRCGGAATAPGTMSSRHEARRSWTWQPRSIEQRWRSTPPTPRPAPGLPACSGGGLVGAATVAIPGVGALIAAGAVVGAIGGAGIGAAAGGLLGALIEHGFSHEEAAYYQEKVHLGATLLMVHDSARADEAHAIMHQHGGHDHHTRPA